MTLAGQRAQFTWSLNQYNSTDDPDQHTRFAKRMAKYIAAAPSNGFSSEQITQGQSYPANEVAQYINDADVIIDSSISEEQAIHEIRTLVDTSTVVRLGDGAGVVYAYGYHCCPDRLKIGYTEIDTVQRIASQINTGTPDRPVLMLEIKTDRCRALERVIQATLEVRGRKIAGAGSEWFVTGRDEVLEIYRFTLQTG